MIERETLYKAYDAAYHKERNHQGVIQFVDLAFVMAGALLVVRGSSWPHLSAVALLWLAIREVPWFLRPDDHRRRAVRIQEQFDCSLGIQPNEVLSGKPIPDHEILALADLSKAQLRPGYLVDVAGVPSEVAVVVLQHQTAAWGEVAHRRYSVLNFVIAFVTILLLVGWSYLSHRDLQDAVTQLFGPAAPFVVGRIQLGRRHRQHSHVRRDVRERAEEALSGVTADPVSHPAPAFARLLQDRIYQSRLTEGRIPGWLYKFHANRDRRTIDRSCQQRADQLKALTRG